MKKIAVQRGVSFQSSHPGPLSTFERKEGQEGCKSASGTSESLCPRLEVCRQTLFIHRHPLLIFIPKDLEMKSLQKHDGNHGYMDGLESLDLQASGTKRSHEAAFKAYLTDLAAKASSQSPPWPCHPS